jgi:hypothetical protein
MPSPITQFQLLGGLSAPLQSASEMEALQKTFGALRALKSGPDEEAEAAYRSRMYSTYTTSLKILTEEDPDMIPCDEIMKSAQTAFKAFDDSFESYFHLLGCMEQHSASASNGDCILGVKKITRDFEEKILFALFVELGSALDGLNYSVGKTGRAIWDLIDAMDPSSADGILNKAECFRVLCGLWEKEEREGRCLQGLKIGMWDAQEIVRKMCYVASDFLDHGRLGDEDGVDGICDGLERLGDKVGTHGWIGLRDVNGNQVDVCDVD